MISRKDSTLKEKINRAKELAFDAIEWLNYYHDGTHREYYQGIVRALESGRVEDLEASRDDIPSKMPSLYDKDEIFLELQRKVYESVGDVRVYLKYNLDRVLIDRVDITTYFESEYEPIRHRKPDMLCVRPEKIISELSYGDHFDELKIPCYRALFKQSDFAQIGWGNITFDSTDEEVPFVVILDGNNKLSSWTIQKITELFGEEAWLTGISKAMDKYCHDIDDKLIDDDDLKAISVDGFTAYLDLCEIIIDEKSYKVIFYLSTAMDGHIDEHGLVVINKDEEWGYDFGDYFVDFYEELQRNGRNE